MCVPISRELFYALGEFGSEAMINWGEVGRVSEPLTSVVSPWPSPFSFPSRPGLGPEFRFRKVVEFRKIPKKAKGEDPLLVSF
jgi:hypothetical protein